MIELTKPCTNKKCSQIINCNKYNKEPTNCKDYKNETTEEKHKQIVFNHNIQTCYRYLDFIEEFFDNYNMTMGEGEDDCLLTYGHDYDLPILQLRNALKFIKKKENIKL